MKNIKFIITFAAALSLTTGLFAQEELKPVMTEKEASSRNDDGTYTLTLKSYVTGKVKPAMSPADVIFAMDFSGSMEDNVYEEDVYTAVEKTASATVKAITKTTKAFTTVTKEKYTAVNKPGTVKTKPMSATDRTKSTTQGWKFNNTTANADGTANYSHYYRDSNGDYYVVHKAKNLRNHAGTATNVRALWYVDKNGNTKYLTNLSEQPSDTYDDTITADGTVIWNGTLYKGWTYKTHSDDSGTQCQGFDNGNETATVAAQWYYLHTDGEYYPVRLANNYPDSNGGNTARVAWVEIDGVQWFLHGDKLDTDYDHDIYYISSSLTGNYRAIWFGPLYKGGWKYSEITAVLDAGSSTAGHYYQYTDGKRYPVQKATETVGGVTTYQAFVEIPGVGKRYLFGTGLSETPCPYSTTNGIFFYFGELYTGGWTTDNITGGTHYYLHSDGEYYPVREIAATGNHQAYVDLPEGRYYFDGNGLCETPDTPYAFSTKKYVALYFGTFYTVTGWTYGGDNGVTAATAANGYFYLYSDGKYYPVLKAQEGDLYQLYVMLPGSDGNLTVKKYLWGHSLHDDPCPYATANSNAIYFGSLYKGGWTQSAITVATSSANGFSYLHTDGEYYPVNKEQVSLTVEGVTKTTYQVYVMLPDASGTPAVKRYLWGDGLHEDPYPYTWVAGATLYFGPLYKGGWTYNNHILTTNSGGEFYLHSDGKYYRVLRATETVNGVTTYQLYMELPEGKRYLYGHTISENPYPYAVQPVMGIYYEALYQGGWAYSGITSGSATGGHYYLHTDGKYYPVKKQSMTLDVDGTNRTTYQVYVMLPEPSESEPTVKWYLTPYGLSLEPYKRSRAEGATIYFGTLYKHKVASYSKYEGLRRAVVAFIEAFSAKAQENNVHHRLALTQLAYSKWSYDPKNNINQPHLKTVPSSGTGGSGGHAAVLSDFKDVTVAANVTDLIATMNATPGIGHESRYGWGLSIANGLIRREAGDTSGYDYDGNGSVDSYETPIISGQDKVNYSDRPKIVIVIGDGEETQVETGRPEGRSQAALLKSASDNVTVVFVHVSTKHATAVINYENDLVSAPEYRYEVDYYDEELIETLLYIGDQIGGAAVELDSRATVQDVVTPEFSIPDGATIEMYTANCIGGTPADDPTQLFFEEESAWEAFDGSYTLAVKDDGTTVLRVTGFDFSANWCGNHGGEDGFMGKELIIRFPILPKEDLVGGIIPTNTSKSDIRDENDNPVEEFPIPKVGPFPVHIQIEKTGLLTEDSAVFAIYRKLKEGGTSYETTPYMTVVLTGIDADGSAVTADIVGLDPDYYYKIVETSWSWRYTPDVTELSTETQTLNPFQFKNTLDTTVTTKNGEDVQHNEFF